MENQNLERIAQTVDELESLIAVLALPMPAEFHVDQMRNVLPLKVQVIKEAIIKESGENPWE